MFAHTRCVRSISFFASVLVCLALAPAAAATTWVSVTPDYTLSAKEGAKPLAPAVSVNWHDADGLSVTVQSRGLSLDPLGDPESGQFVSVSWPGARLDGQVGAPALPVGGPGRHSAQPTRS